MTNRKSKFLWYTYILMVIFTFGYAYNHYPNEGLSNDIGTKCIGSAISSLYWPFYWSVKVTNFF